jgi:two-component system chemotaxis response regulator CheB
MTVYKSGGSYRVKCYPGEKVSGHCPSVDVLFESVAKEAGSDAVGVLLTGMGADGAKGLLSMRTRGAKTIGQDKESSLVYGMPKVAFEIGAVTQQAPLDEIPQPICSFLSRS